MNVFIISYHFVVSVVRIYPSVSGVFIGKGFYEMALKLIGEFLNIEVWSLGKLIHPSEMER